MLEQFVSLWVYNTGIIREGWPAVIPYDTKM
jgi:hypothetical protein